MKARSFTAVMTLWLAWQATTLSASDEGYLGVVIGAEAREVTARVGGRLVEVHVRIGDRVSRGASLALLDDEASRRALAIAEADLEAVTADRRKAEAERTVAQNAFTMREGAPGLFSRQEILVAREQAKAATAQADRAAAEVREAELRVDQARRDLEAMHLVSPVDGVVAARLKEPGMLIEAGAAVVRVSAEGGRWVRFAVPPGEAVRLAPGSPVDIRVAEAAATVRATVRQVAPEPDDASGMTFAEAVLETGEAGRAVPVGGVVRVFPVGR